MRIQVTDELKKQICASVFGQLLFEPEKYGVCFVKKFKASGTYCTQFTSMDNKVLQ